MVIHIFWQICYLCSHFKVEVKITRSQIKGHLMGVLSTIPNPCHYFPSVFEDSMYCFARISGVDLEVISTDYPPVEVPSLE